MALGCDVDACMKAGVMSQQAQLSFEAGETWGFSGCEVTRDFLREP